MNFVDMIKDQLTGPILDKLSASIGETGEKTKAATDAAVPSLLSALSGLVASSHGAETLIKALRNFDGDSLNRLRTDLTKDDGGKIHDQGSDILGSLLGGNLSALINILAKYSGVGAAALKSLLSYLAPLILSALVAHMKGKSLTAASLGEFFNDQKANIQGALPGGLSLAAISPAPSAPSTKVAPRAEAPGTPGWLLPLAALALLGIAAWYFLGNQPVEQPGGIEPPVVETPIPAPAPAPAPTPSEPKAIVDPNAPIPTADEVTASLDEVYTTATQSLTSVKDAATAEAAVPALDGLTAKIDAAKALWGRLPAFSQAVVAKATAEKLSTFKTLIDKTLELPGVGDKLKAILDALVAKLNAFAAVDSSAVPPSN